MSEDKKSFTIKDRRHFTPEGEARGEEREESSSPPEGPSPPETPAPPAPPSPQEAVHPPSSPSAGPAGVDFAGFVVSLGAQCGFLLSSEEGGPHLREARQIISVLEMLQEKTEGRRTNREDEVLSQILYELRMAYVAHATPKGAP
jgi:hypothetical protein